MYCGTTRLNILPSPISDDGGVLMRSYLDAADTLPLALVISVPLVSLTLLCLLVGFAVCIKRALVCTD